MRSLTRTSTTTLVHLDGLLIEAQSWDEYALRQRLVSLHGAATALQEDLGVQFPADLIPRRLVRAVETSADVLGEALADLDALHYSGQHRRPDVAQDAALCQYRDDAEAIHGYGHRGLHRTRRRARMAAQARPVERHTNGGAL